MAGPSPSRRDVQISADTARACAQIRQHGATTVPTAGVAVGHTTL